MIVLRKATQNGYKQNLEELLSPPVKIELYKNGEEWVGTTDELEPAFYQYKVEYSLYEYQLGKEIITIDKEGREHMYLNIQ